MDEFYPWIKAIHIVAIISWMAGLLYLPRLFVYHCRAETGSGKSETFKIMERRLFGAIMIPAMIVTWITGSIMVYLGTFWPEPWFWAKGLFILILTIAHEFFGAWRKAFEADSNTRSEKFYRIANEVPTLAMIAIVVLVTVKPF